MKRKVTAALLLALACLAAPAWGSIIYSVDRDIGIGWVRGTIETSGATGRLQTGTCYANGSCSIEGNDILGWNLHLFDGLRYFTITDSNSYLYAYAYDDYTETQTNFYATESELTYDFAAGGLALFQRGHEGDGWQSWALSSLYGGLEAVWASPEWERYERDEPFVERSGQVVIATAIVPEPATLGLLSLGMAGLFASRRIRR